MIHAEGKLGEVFVRRSTNTRSWQQALGIIRMATREGVWPQTKEETEKLAAKRVSQAIDEFLVECESERGKGLSRPTLVKYRTVLNRLSAFCSGRNILALNEIDLPKLKAFRQTWPTGPAASANNIARLRSFWKFALDHEYAQKNVAMELEMPRGVAQEERMPFSEEEMSRILEAARTLKLNGWHPFTNQEIEAFILVQRYGGLAIADAALLKKVEVTGDEIRYYRKKLLRHPKRTHVIVPLPSFVLDKLNELPGRPNGYYFCHGNETAAVAADVWWGRLKKVFVLAGVPDGTSHRFRHTFAYDLLTQGISIQRVSKWLGHSSIKVTEKHYNHFLEGRIQADNDVLRELYEKRKSSST
jgi:site-specific recombinase XerD